MGTVTGYDRRTAVAYAHAWAFGRNPAYYNYDKIGGDCTNFASQCLFAGCGIMDYTRDLGWYYIGANNKSPSWTGVEYLNNFLTRPNATPGPKGEACAISELEPGDLVQLSFTGEEFAHSPVVVAVAPPYRPENILVAAHSYDADYRPLSTYEYAKARFIHIKGALR